MTVASQLPTFADEQARPAGLRYQPAFVSPAEEQELIARIGALPLALFSGVVFFGIRYDFTHQKLEKAEDLPTGFCP
jgi:hypothetical protein